MRDDPTALVGIGGLLGAITFEHVNQLVSFFIGLATLIYIVTKWQLLVRKNGGFWRLFSRSPAVPLPSEAVARHLDGSPEKPETD